MRVILERQIQDLTDTHSFEMESDESSMRIDRIKEGSRSIWQKNSLKLYS
jgi:hypothetical protein